MTKFDRVNLLRDATILFLIKRNEERISEICLAMKKRGFGAGRWNGAGGKVEAEETIEEATVREAKEEIGVEARDLRKVAEFDFYFRHKPAWDQRVHVFMSENWKGEPSESEEMKPEWFRMNDLPFDSMWPDDRFWLPKVLDNKFVNAIFVFSEEDVILDKKVTENKINPR